MGYLYLFIVSYPLHSILLSGPGAQQAAVPPPKFGGRVHFVTFAPRCGRPSVRHCWVAVRRRSEDVVRFNAAVKRSTDKRRCLSFVTIMQLQGTKVCRKTVTVFECLQIALLPTYILFKNIFLYFGNGQPRESAMCHYCICKQNLLTFIQLKWQLRTCLLNHYNVLF